MVVTAINQMTSSEASNLDVSDSKKTLGSFASDRKFFLFLEEVWLKNAFLKKKTFDLGNYC